MEKIEPNNEKNLNDFITELTNQVLLERPDDCEEFLVDYLLKLNENKQSVMN